MGDALSHGILPGIAVAYLSYGLSVWALTFGGIIAGLMVAGASYFIAHYTLLREDAALTGIYLVALATGVFILSASGGQMCVMHFLFGDILGVTHEAFLVITALAFITPASLCIIFRPLSYSAFDPIFCKSNQMPIQKVQAVFLGFVVINLVIGCQAMGTIMTLGIMMVPAVAARVLSERLVPMMFLSAIIGVCASYFGILISYHFNYSTSPAIVMTAGFLWILALFFRKKT